MKIFTNTMPSFPMLFYLVVFLCNILFEIVLGFKVFSKIRKIRKKKREFHDANSIGNKVVPKCYDT